MMDLIFYPTIRPLTETFPETVRQPKHVIITISLFLHAVADKVAGEQIHKIVRLCLFALQWTCRAVTPTDGLGYPLADTLNNVAESMEFNRH